MSRIELEMEQMALFLETCCAVFVGVTYPLFHFAPLVYARAGRTLYNATSIMRRGDTVADGAVARWVSGETKN